MSARVSRIWRHPIKAHGREELETTMTRPGECLPGDRAWAVAHERAAADGREWAHCGNFSRAAKLPALQAIRARLNEAAGENGQEDGEAVQITLTHPDLPSLTFRPGEEDDAFVDWANRLVPDGHLRSARLVRAQGPALTDTPFPSVSLLNRASNAAVAQRLGRDVSPERWRGNILLDGLAPWQEFEWIGRRVKIGEAVLTVRERIGRCQATSVDVTTGRRDTDMLDVLRAGWGHTDFGVYAVVEKGGRIARGDTAEVLP